MDYVKNIDLCRCLSLLLVVCTQKVEEFTAPVAGEYKLECWGSQGGTTVEKGIPGKGGYCIGAYSSLKNDILYICVGNCGSFGTHSYYNNPGLELIGGFPGGGATHISIKNGGELITFKTHQEDVLIVAGAGGSCDLDSYISGCGGYGGDIGGNGTSSYSMYYGKEDDGSGNGGTSSRGGETGYSHPYTTYKSYDGSFGIGGYGYSVLPDLGINYGGQGGGGWYGGGGATLAGSGGGGSSYGNIKSLVPDSYKTINGDHEMPSPSGGTEIGHSGDGACVISWFLK